MQFAALKFTRFHLMLSGCLLISAQAAEAQRFVATPGFSVLSGDPLKLQLVGLPAGSVVTLQSSRSIKNDGENPARLYQAQARFKANAQGRIDLSTQAPLDGSYSNADVRGLFWSMTPTPTPTRTPSELTLSDAANASGAAQATSDTQIILTASIGGKLVAKQTVNLLAGDPRLKSVPVAEFAGAQFVALPGTAKRPAIIVLGGSEGGAEVSRVMAPKLASHGFAVLGLPYYSPSGYGPNGPTPPELPTLPAAFADIPVDRLQQARDWLARQPNVDAARIAVYGVSKGAEFALIASTRMPWIKAVVAVVPSDVVWEGWGPGAEKGDRPSFSWKGEPLAFVPYLDFASEFDGFRTNTPVIVRRPQDRGRAANPDRVSAARIPAERYVEPMLLVAGGDDQLWDSGGMAKNISASRSGLPNPR
jgi:Acyl-CoA thioester hydrolase/BAAT N-terminal region/BAAT / Acyl-CoA thioester hydrolase C terminal